MTVTLPAGVVVAVARRLNVEVTETDAIERWARQVIRSEVREELNALAAERADRLARKLDKLPKALRNQVEAAIGEPLTEA